MPRKKEYIEEEVIKKALALFWVKGFEMTSMEMLEREMGINKFSIYSSFGSKEGLYLECIKFYRKETAAVLNKLKTSNNGVLGIKQYFYDYMAFTREGIYCKGCFMVNTTDELGEKIGPNVQGVIGGFMQEITELFMNNLKQDVDTDSIAKQVEYLIMSKIAMVTVSKMFTENQMNNYIENIFKNI